MLKWAKSVNERSNPRSDLRQPGSEINAVDLKVERVVALQSLIVPVTNLDDAAPSAEQVTTRNQVRRFVGQHESFGDEREVVSQRTNTGQEAERFGSRHPDGAINGFAYEGNAARQCRRQFAQADRPAIPDELSWREQRRPAY